MTGQATPDGAFTYRAAGSGEALVLLHGIGSNAASWAAQLESLSGHYRVVAWDAPGYGGSKPLGIDRPVPSDYAAALARFLDALGIRRCHLLGHSLGALIAAAFARAHPERVRALILADAAGGYRTPADAPLPEAAVARLDELAARGPAGLAAARAPRLLSANAAPAAVERVRAAMATVRPEGYGPATAMLAQGDLLADLAHARCPVLVLCGTEDRVTPEAGNRAAAAAAPDGRYVALPGLGHASYVEDPAAFDAAVLAFLGARDG